MPSRLAAPAFVSVLAVAALLPTIVLVISSAALAKDGGGGSSGSGGSSGGGSSSGGSGGASSGSSGGSGSGSGGDGSSSGGSGGRGGDGGEGSGPPASGGRHDGPDHGRAVSARDQDDARDAVMRGAAVPLARVLPTVRARVPGDVLDVKVRRLASGGLVYDVTVLSTEGEYRSIVVDAKRNRIIEGGQR